MTTHTSATADVVAELDAVKFTALALSGLDPHARRRVIRYLCDRYQIQPAEIRSDATTAKRVLS